MVIGITAIGLLLFLLWLINSMSNNAKKDMERKFQEDIKKLKK
jgi:hypothetical protein